MNKFILRIVFLITLFVTLIFNFKPVDPILFFNNTLPGRLITVIFVFGIIYLWGFMFYHWGTNNFNRRIYKIAWFWIMILGLYIGALVYYIFVYELGKTLLKKNNGVRPQH